MIIDTIQHWKVFREITELFILMPVLLNLKGNLEMGLAARLSTVANRNDAENNKESSEDIIDLVMGNVYLVQFQAITAGLLVGVLSVILGTAAHGSVNSLKETLLILACSVSTSFLSSMFTSGLLAVIIVRSRSAHINPDNISTPLANCLGDFSTMIVLAGISRVLFALDSTALNSLILSGSLGLGLLWLMLVKRNATVRALIWSCWPPVIGAILISSVAGLAFERFVRYFEGLGLILTVANGISGNAASILAARFATSLQIEGVPDRHRNRAAHLSIILLCTPLHVLFLLFLHLADLGHTSVSLAYTVGHLLASNLQLLGILWVVPRLVQAIWRKGLDPDSYTMPLLAAITDLGGTAIFIGAFSILWLLGDRDANVGT